MSKTVIEECVEFFGGVWPNGNSHAWLIVSEDKTRYRPDTIPFIRISELCAIHKDAFEKVANSRKP